MRSTPYQPVRILVVEDDACSRFIIGRALTRSLGCRGTVHLVEDGHEAISYLSGEGEYGNRQLYPFPTVLITDLNMPRVDGFAVLEFLSVNPAWSVIPKIIFTSSVDPDDVRTAFLLGASAFHQKPCSAEAFGTWIDLMLAYWLTCYVPEVDIDGRVVPTVHSGKLGERYPLPVGGPSMVRPTTRTT